MVSPKNPYGITVVEESICGYPFAANHCAYAGLANIGVDAKGKIKDSRVDGKIDQISLRGVGVDFFLPLAAMTSR